MQFHQLLNVFHLVVQRQFHPFEDTWHHLLTDEVMTVERPAQQVVPLFAGGFPDIVEQGCPTYPQLTFRPCHLFRSLSCIRHRVIFLVPIGCGTRHIVKHFQSVVEIVLMRLPVFGFHLVEVL